MKPDPTVTPATAGTTVEYQVRFGTAPKGRKRVRAADPVTQTVPTPPVARPAHPVGSTVPSLRTVVAPETARTPRIPKAVLYLVLGHYFERLVRSGAVRDYAEIARRTGLTRARVTQIVDLTLLAPDEQERLLTGLTEPTLLT